MIEVENVVHAYGDMIWHAMTLNTNHPRATIPVTTTSNCITLSHSFYAPFPLAQHTPLNPQPLLQYHSHPSYTTHTSHTHPQAAAHPHTIRTIRSPPPEQARYRTILSWILVPIMAHINVTMYRSHRTRIARRGLRGRRR